MAIRDAHELPAVLVSAIREKAGITNGAGRFIVDCDCGGWNGLCDCVGSYRLALCDLCATNPADHPVGNEMLCTACRDGFAAEPTLVIPREPMAKLMERIGARGMPTAEELDAELKQHAEAGS